jgi:hypothetical protein
VHRLLNQLSAYVRDLSRSSLRAWTGFFFTASDPTTLGLIRVLVGVLLFWDVAVLGLDLHDYLGSQGWIGPEAVRQYLALRSPWAWSFWPWVPDRWLPAAWAGCLVVMALFTVGLWSRVTAVLAWAIVVSIARRAPVALFGFDQMISTWALYLAAFGASGQALSLDRVLSRRRASRGAGPGRGDAEMAAGNTVTPPATVSANLSLRLIQLHLALVYGSSGLSKLMGREWWDGTAMEMIILTPEFRRFDLVWLLAYPTLLSLATHAGHLLEIAYPILIWSRKLRPLLLLAVVLMHLGIDLLLGLTEFGLTMIVANLAFIPGAWLRETLAGSQGPSADELGQTRCPGERTLAASGHTPLTTRAPASTRR